MPGDDPLFRLLQLDRIEVGLYEAQMARAYLKAHGMTGVHVLTPPLFVREQYIYLHKSNAGLAPAIAAALRAMKRDGAYQRAYREKLFPFQEEGSR